MSTNETVNINDLENRISELSKELSLARKVMHHFRFEITGIQNTLYGNRPPTLVANKNTMTEWEKSFFYPKQKE